ncbi:hypothetical protein [Paenibacillus elgii]|uniref:hypothetical protein n=2 Tax=Paenibacillus elgii TaxID=189691 RepID=UPI000FDB7CC1|nr:hypothetical protein [Paenibacillus elgii]NEN86947.1 hypothetical protein [Paenibacillus elgii]
MMKLNHGFYSRFNEGFVTKIKNTPQFMKEMMEHAFPDEETPIDHWGSDSLGGAEFFVDNTNQIVKMISLDYEDSERFGEDDEELLQDEDRRWKQYEMTIKQNKEDNSHFFVDIVDLIKDELKIAEPQYIAGGDKQVFCDFMPEPTSQDHSIFDASEYFFSSYANISAYWMLSDRIAFVQYAESDGDGDVQIYVTIGVIRRIIT